jgi:hypothetical protein
MAFIDTVRTKVSTLSYQRMLLVLVLFVPYVVGWLFGKSSQGFQLLLYALGWLGGKMSVAARYAGASVKTGWDDARSGPDKGGRT